MNNITALAQREMEQREKFESWLEGAEALPWGYLKKRRTSHDAYRDPNTTDMWGAWQAASTEMVEALQVRDKQIAELEREKEALRPVGVISEKAYHRLENSESRFIALWPRPGIYLPRKRPEDGVIVYARTANIQVIEGEE
ncbi:hypothetical protein VSS87_03450 [Escherichia coli]|uniref:hypothetical protein n=1 Tax=Escherichia coli TaxID=562 RepID=UPI002022CB87|nr:hypothetical protein [Escherichia coli]MCO0526065.1 hypothetical protein [Escherichia coli]MEC4631403.1 hypothetical protein [Escherichia coli]UHP19209.1 hypothetical protein LQQ61_14325 [Escherichia coli]